MNWLHVHVSLLIRIRNSTIVAIEKLTIIQPCTCFHVQKAWLGFFPIYFGYFNKSGSNLILHPFTQEEKNSLKELEKNLLLPKRLLKPLDHGSLGKNEST